MTFLACSKRRAHGASCCIELLHRGAKTLRAAWATSIGAWEKFQFVAVGNGNYAIKANANGLYVSADMNVANTFFEAQWATTIGGWEQFQCIKQ